MSVKIDKEKCNLCGQCINMCIMRQIKIENKVIFVNHECYECLNCVMICPQDAISA